MASPVIKLNNGHVMPQLGLGTWQSKAGEVSRAVKHAIDVGYRHIDTAFAYGNEAEIGDALKEKLAEKKVKREDIFLTTKLWCTHHRPDMIIPQLKKQLKSLQLEYVDLYLMHNPQAFKEGDDLRPEENGKIIMSDVDYLDTWKEMEKCVDLGLTKSIGVSNFNSVQLDRLLNEARIKPVTNQVEAHPYLNQKKLQKFCLDRDIPLTAYSPLGSPEHPSVANKEVPRPLTNEVVVELGKKYNKSPGQILIRYHLDVGNIVIPKSVNNGRIEENFDVFDFKLSEEDLNRLNSLKFTFRYCPWEFAVGGNHYPFDIEF